MNDLASNLPKLSGEKRDGDGRLIGVVIDSSQAPAQAQGLAADSWLVAVDGSPHSLRAVSEAARLAADLKSSVLHLVHVQGWLAREAAEAELALRCWAASAPARAELDARGQAWRLHGVMGEVAEGIVSLAQELGCRGIVIGSRGVGAAENLLVGSVAYKLIHLSTSPVMVVR